MSLTDSLHFPLLLLLDLLVAAAAIAWVLWHPREPRAMLAWILAFVLMPFLGVALFLLIGEPRLRRLRKRRRRRRARLAMTDHAAYQAAGGEQVLPSRQARLARLIGNTAERYPVGGHRLRIHLDGAQAFDDLEQAIRAARDHIHLEFYMFRGDRTGRRIAAALIERARAGVECRLLVDFIGSMGLLTGAYRRLRQAGVEVAFFMPIIPWRGRWRMNFRNHRKIAIVDGRLAFTGSQNVGDEYAGLDQQLGEWRDTQLEIQGPMVHELQEIFLEDWHFASGREVVSERYFPDPEAPAGDAILQLVPSGPDLRVRVVQLMFHTLFAAASREICIATPYFIPDDALLLALQSAAYRGVRVRLLIPSRTDQRFSLWAARSYYAELCAAGIQIYEYPHGMLHSKVVIVDGHWAAVGSANMDERSFRLNFEVSLLIYSETPAAELQAEFERLRKASQAFHHGEIANWSLRQHFLLGLARLGAPLL